MKRILVRPGKSVVVSAEVAEMAARSLRKFAFTREEVERMAATEPRGITVYSWPAVGKGWKAQSQVGETIEMTGACTRRLVSRAPTRWRLD